MIALELKPDENRKDIKGYIKELIQLGPPQNALRGATVVTFACCARMPPILLI